MRTHREPSLCPPAAPGLQPFSHAAGCLGTKLPQKAFGQPQPWCSSSRFLDAPRLTSPLLRTQLVASSTAPHSLLPHTALGQIPLCLPGPCWPPLPYSTSKEGTDQPPSTNPAPLCSYSRKHSLGRQTWRVVEEVDNALLGCVEEGSGHRVVLSISTEKLRRGRKKNELEVADMGCPGAARTAGLWLAEEPRADLGTWGTPAELRAGHRVREENGMKSERGRCFSRISGLAASHVSVQPKRKVPKP